jgi:hypothetical protein
MRVSTKYVKKSVLYENCWGLKLWQKLPGNLGLFDIANFSSGIFYDNIK